MSDRPRRPILSLKFAVAPKEPEPELRQWKCRPCGTAFTLSASVEDEEAVRCASCNAKLGLARDFRATPPLIEKLRARPVAAAPAAPAALGARSR